MSLSDSSTSVLEDNRFAVITEDNHTGVLWVVSILCLIYTVMVFLLRLEARRKNLGLDDLLSVISTLFASIQYILIFLANSQGLGKSYATITSADADKIGKYVYASQIILLLALGFAKCSVICLCRRLFSSHMKSSRILCDVVMGLCILWSVASILAIAIDCSPLDVIGYNTGFCHNLVTRWMAVGILDAVTEVAIVAIAFGGLWPLQMSLSRKLQAMATFVIRLIIVAFAALHTTTLREATEVINIGVALTKPTIYLQIELLYSLLSASIPALNRWLRNFDTSMGSAWMYGSQAHSMNNSKMGTGRGESQAFPLESIHRAGDRDRKTSRASLLGQTKLKRSSAAMKSGEFVPPGPKYSASTQAYATSQSSQGQERPDSTGMNSDEMIIRKDVHWHVQYEQNGSVHGDLS